MGQKLESAAEFDRELPLSVHQPALFYLFDTALFVAILGFSALTLFALALAAPLAIAAIAIAGAFSSLKGGCVKRGGWRVAGN